MRFITRLLWIFTFVLATYSWMVAFEHGFAWKGFQTGFKSEWRNVSAMLMGEFPKAPAQQTPPTAKSTAPAAK